MFVAGIPVRDELVLELARMVDDDALAERLEECYRRSTAAIGLTIRERETLLVALEDAPAGCEELRGVLLREHTWRQREGFV